MSRRNTPRSRRARIVELLATGGIGAIAVTLVGTPPGWAQSFLGNGFANYNTSSNQVTASIDGFSTPNVTNITINEDHSIITWDATGAPGTGTQNFQSAGTTATFSGFDAGLTDYTVLNIVQTDARPIQFNGTVNSEVWSAGGPVQGGKIWFYNPTGIIVGAGAQFNVGSLLLTTMVPNDLESNPQVHFDEIGVRLLGAPDGTAGVTIQSGATINASNYVALAASNISQRGVINAGGEVAMVTGEDISLTMPFASNLFGIEVNVGSDAVTSNGQSITHLGSTNGPSNGGTTARKMYFVAVPKNDAATILLQGDIGYSQAINATASLDGTIVLAGNGAFIEPLTGNLGRPIGNGTITAGQGLTISTNAQIWAPTVNLTATTGDLALLGNADISAITAITTNVATGRAFTVGNGALGSLTMAAYNLTDGGQVAGNIATTVAGTFRVANALSMTANSFGMPDSGNGAESVVGGTIGFTVNGGAVYANTLSMTSNAVGGNGIDGAQGTGGNISLTLNGGLVSLGLGATLTANGTGGTASGIDTGTAGPGQGGTVVVTLAPDTGSGPDPVLQSATGGFNLAANGYGGAVDCSSCVDGSGHIVTGMGATGGSGTGGTARIAMNRGTFQQFGVTLAAIGQGINGGYGADIRDAGSIPYDGGAGGAGQGGLAQFTQTGGTAQMASLSLNASGQGGNGGTSSVDYYQPLDESGNGGVGGAGTGGTINLILQPTTTSILRDSPTSGTAISLVNQGFGGDGGGSYSHGSGDGGAGSGGTVNVQTGTGSIVTASVLQIDTLGAGGLGGAGIDILGAGGNGSGGTFSFSQNGGAITATTTLITAAGRRGYGGGNNGVGVGETISSTTPTGYGSGGVATGALVTITSAGSGSMTLGNINAQATAYGLGGEPALANVGGSANGGRFVMLANGGIINFSSIIANAWAEGAAAVGVGGDAVGGQVTLGAGLGGAINGGGADFFGVSGVGGNASSSGGGGYGQGGTVTILANGGLLGLGTVSIDASATGGDGEDANIGAAGIITLGARNGGSLFTSGGVNAFATRADGVGQVEAIQAGGAVLVEAQSGSIAIGGAFVADVSDLRATAEAGSITIRSTTGTGDYGTMTFGETSLLAQGPDNGRITIQNSSPEGREMRFATLTLRADEQDTSAEAIQLIANNAPINITGISDVQTGGSLLFSATGAGTFNLTGNGLFRPDGNIRITHAGATAPTITGGSDLELRANFDYDQATGLVQANNLAISGNSVIASQLAGGNSIIIEAGLLQLGNAIVSGPASYMPDGSPASGVASIDIVGSGVGNLNFNGIVSANGSVTISGLSDINLFSTAQITSLNRVSLTANGSVVAAPGSLIRAADAARPGVGTVSIAAGEGFASGLAKVIKFDGTITGAGSVSLLADAIETTTGTINGGAISAQLRTGTLTGDDPGVVNPFCRGGNICLGALNGTGAITIGTTGRTPTSLRLAGNITGSSIDARATSTILLGAVSQIRTIAVTGLASFDAGTGTIGDLGGVALTAGSARFAAGLDIAASALNVRTTSGDIRIGATRDVYFGALDSAGAIGSLTGGALTLSRIFSVTGTTALGAGALDLTANSMAFNQVTTAAGTSLRLNSATALVIPGLNAAGAVSLSAAGVTVTSTAPLNLTSLDSRTLDAIVNSAGSLTLGGFTGRNLTMNVSTGNITASGIAATGGVQLTAANGGATLTAPGALNLVSATTGAGGLTITSGNSMTAAQINSIGGVTLTSSNGSVTVNDVTIANGPPSAAGQITTQAVATGDLVLTAAQSAVFNGTSNVRGAIIGTAPSVAVNGTLIAPTISFASTSLTVGSAAQIGALGTTTSVAFRNSGTGASTIGGTGTAGYTIGSAAIGRVRSASISFDLPGDVTLAPFSVAASGTGANLTSTGSLIVRTPGRVQVTGAVAGTGFASGNTLRIEGGQGIDVIAPGGSILLADASGAPAGSLELVAPTVRVATAQALTDLAAANSVDARAARLATNDGAVNDQGFLQADRMLFQVSNGVFVQNTGGSEFAARRGITAGSGGLLIAATGTSAPEVILNGRVRLANGSFSTGGDVGAALRLSGATSLATGSVANGCSFLTGCFVVNTPIDMMPAFTPQQDVVGIVDDSEDEDSEEDRPTSPVVPTMTPLIQVQRSLDFDPTGGTESPMVGAGNDVLWITGVGGDIGGADGPSIGVGTGADGPINTNAGGTDRGAGGGTSFGVGADRGGTAGGNATGPGAQGNPGNNTGPQGGGATGGQDGRPGGVNGAGADTNRAGGAGGTGAIGGGNGGGITGPNDRPQGQAGAGGGAERPQR